MLRRSVPRGHGAMRFPVGSNPALRMGHDIHPMVPANHLYHDPARLRARLDQDGYLYLKNVVPRPAVVRAFTDVANQLAENGWTRECDAKAQVARNGFSYNVPFLLGGDDANGEKNGVEALPPLRSPIRMTKNMMQVVVGTSAMAVARQVFGGGVQAMDHNDLEMVHPGEASGFHMPAVYTNRGTQLLLNAWIPLHDCPLATGGIVLAQGSNSAAAYANIRRTYGAHEVQGGDVRGDGCFTQDPEELLPYGCPLVTSAFECGDIVLSTVYTMQSMLTNRSDTWRLSFTSRWMMEGDDVGPDPRYAGAGATGLSAWRGTNMDASRYPRTMAEAKKAWGVDAPPKDVAIDAPSPAANAASKAK